MITAPAGWIVERTEDGVLLCPPEGPARALLRYAERRRPVRRAVDLVRGAPVPAGFVAGTTAAPRRLTTRENEHAALVVRTGTVAGVAVELVNGYVFLDDYYAALEGVVAGGMLDVVEQILLGDVHLLGSDRRRRFAYAPPPGWQGTGDTFDARWYPLDHPRNPGRLIVTAALPATLAAAAGIVQQMVGERSASVPPPEQFTSRHGLAGLQYALELGTHMFFLSDDRYLYSVRVDHELAAGRALVESIEPVPHFRLPDADSFRFWAD